MFCRALNIPLRLEEIDAYSFTQAVAQRWSVKNVFLEISQNSQESACARVFFFNKVAGLSPATLSKKRL